MCVKSTLRSHGYKLLGDRYPWTYLQFWKKKIKPDFAHLKISVLDSFSTFLHMTSQLQVWAQNCWILDRSLMSGVDVRVWHLWTADYILGLTVAQVFLNSGRGVIPKQFGVSVHPIWDQNLQFSLPYV